MQIKKSLLAIASIACISLSSSKCFAAGTSITALLKKKMANGVVLSEDTTVKKNKISHAHGGGRKHKKHHKNHNASDRTILSGDKKPVSGDKKPVSGDKKPVSGDKKN